VDEPDFRQQTADGPSGSRPICFSNSQVAELSCHLTSQIEATIEIANFGPVRRPKVYPALKYNFVEPVEGDCFAMVKRSIR
jgi:hypothetical protein